MVKRDDEIELSIHSLAFGGAGVGRYETAEGSLAVFVEDTVPGDVVIVRMVSKKRNYAYGYIKSFVKRADDRIEPRCKHFGREAGLACGGCSLQYLKYEDQLKIKEQHVRDAMQRIGGFEGNIVLPIIGCREPWFYRNKMEFSFSKTPVGELSLGLHVRRRHHDVTELEECFLMSPYIGDFVKTVRDFIREELKDGKKNLKLETTFDLKSLVIREGKNTGEVMVNLITENGEPKFLDTFVEIIRNFFEKEDFLENLREKGAQEKSASAARPSDFFGEEGPAGSKRSSPSQKLTSIYFTNIINKKGSPKSVQEKLLWGEQVIKDYLQLENGEKLTFEILPQAFFQPNTKQAEVLYHQAIQAVKLSGNETVFDLFCGAGTIGIFCAKNAKKVYGIEMNESAIKNARTNALLNNINNIEFLVGDVDKHLPTITDRPDVIIVDPPRNGLEPKVVEKTATFKPKRLVYVSCNPTSLARDLKLFTKTGYRLVSVQPVDMFPQTYHIENVALLECF